jgi:NHLM bacteriocin system ABC transporter ATP-binding protein
MTGPAMWISGDDAIQLESVESPSRLVSGSMAVFAIDKETGERLHLFSLKSGDFLLPVDVPADGAWEIAAIPLEACCLQPAGDLPGWESVFVFENWLALLGECLARFRPPGLDGGNPAAAEVTIALVIRALLDALDEVRRKRESASDPLFDAFRAAAAVLGVTARSAFTSGQRADAVREIAQASGMRTRMVLLAGTWWRRESGAMVGHSANGNPVALVPRRDKFRSGYEIFDPVAGTRERVNASSATSLNAYAQMLYRPLPEDLAARSLLRHAFGSCERDVRTVVLSAVGAAVLALAAPQGFAILIGQAIPDADSNVMWQVGGGLIAAAFGSAIFLLTQAIAILRLQSTAFVTLQTGVWDYLLKLSPEFFRGFTAGQLRVRADAVTRIQQLLTADALRSILAGAASFFSLVLLVWYSPAIALIAFAGGAAIVIHAWLGARAIYRVQQQWLGLEELLSGLVLQTIHAVSKLRVAGASNRAYLEWAREYSRMQELTLDMQTRKDHIRLFNLVLPTLAMALAFFYLLERNIATGGFLACIAAMTSFLAAVTSASESVSGLVLVANKWRQMRTILEAKPEVDGSKIHPGRLRGAIRVENLMFRYRSDGPMILNGVSIRAEPGECIALTGPSGSGKSTLVNLMLRFEAPHSGVIHLDGRELSSLDITAVRRQVGVVTQDGRIMAGSLYGNICHGGVNTMEEAWDAARAAGLGEDIEAMPMGMHTIVSEGGGNLSGGQRQRVLIARALILKPAILIFDEATSALDNRTQAIVTESLKRLRATRILVAHRLSTIRHADRIYVIDKGRVVQEGRFEELAAETGLFAELVRRQTA